MHYATNYKFKKITYRISKSTRYGTWLVRFPTQEDTTAYIGSTCINTRQGVDITITMML